jgi:hypothetical protein
MELVWPAGEYLPGYIHALQQGWSPDNLRAEAAQEELARIAEDSSRFLTEQVDREAKGPKVITPDCRIIGRCSLDLNCSHIRYGARDAVHHLAP